MQKAKGMKPSSSLAPPLSSPGTKRKLLEEPCKCVESKLDSSCVAKSATLPSSTVEYLKAWIMSPDHMLHPYPTDIEKADIMRATGIEMKQLTNWFTNNRKRFWKPRIAAMRENGTIKFDGSACPAAGSHLCAGKHRPRRQELTRGYQRPRCSLRWRNPRPA